MKTIKNVDDEERIIKIGVSLGSGGRVFSIDDVKKVDNFILDAEVNYTLAQMVLNGEICVGINELGEIGFSDDPSKFK